MGQGSPPGGQQPISGWIASLADRRDADGCVRAHHSGRRDVRRHGRRCAGLHRSHALGLYDEPDRTRVIAGIESLDAISRTRYGRVFASCTPPEQDTLLLELDREGPSHWFGTVKDLTIWGYFTSEVGVVRELGQWPSPGRYDGCAPYSPRPRKAQVK